MLKFGLVLGECELRKGEKKGQVNMNIIQLIM